MNKFERLKNELETNETGKMKYPLKLIQHLKIFIGYSIYTNIK